MSIAKNGDIIIEWYSEQIDSNWKRDVSISVSPLNLNEAIGAWAKKLEAVGIFSTEVTERNWDHTPELPPARLILNMHKLLACHSRVCDSNEQPIACNLRLLTTNALKPFPVVAADAPFVDLR